MHYGAKDGAVLTVRVPAGDGAKRARFKEDLVLGPSMGDDDFNENGAVHDKPPAGPQRRLAPSGEAEEESSEENKELTEHGRAIKYVVPKIEGKVPLFAQSPFHGRILSCSISTISRGA